MCNHSQTDRILWRVNGSALDFEIFPENITTGIICHPDGGQVHTLTIRGHPEHNGTTIQCLAVFFDGSHPDESPTVTFLIQGQFPAIILCLMIWQL